MYRLSRRSLVLVLSLLIVTVPALAQHIELHHLTSGYSVHLQDLLRNVLVPAFQEKTGITVRIEEIPWANRVERILLLHAAGTPPDVVSTGYYSHYEEVSQGLLAPLSHYIADWQIADDIPAPIWEALRWNGEIHVVPQQFEIRGVGYNKNTFAESGFDPTMPPSSWDDMLLYAQRMTRLDSAGERVAQRGLHVQFNLAQTFMWFMVQTDVQPVDPVTLQSNLDRPEAAQTLNFLLDLARAGHRRMSGPTVNGLIDGTTAISFAHPGMMQNWVRTDPEVAETVSFFAPQRTPDSQPVAINFINGLAIPAASTNKDAAWQWIAFLLSDEAQYLIHETTGWVSPRASLANDLQFVPGLEYFYRLIPYSWAPLIPPPRDIGQADVADMFTEVLNETIPPQEALMNAHDLWSRLLREWVAEQN